MRIAHVTATFPPYYAGTGIVCFHNAVELAKRGHNVTVYTSETSNRNLNDPPEIKIHRLRPILRLGNAPLLPGLMRIRNYELIHLHYPFIFGAELIRAISSLRQIPYLITYHSDLIGKGYRKILFDTYLSLTANIVFQKAVRIIAVTREHTAYSSLNHLFARYEDKMDVVPNGIDIDLFRPIQENRTSKSIFNLDNDAKVILFVSALDEAHHYKGLDFLLELFSSFTNSKLFLVVIGEGDLKSYYQERASMLGITDKVKFIGGIPNEELPQYYQSADIFVLPSNAETFGIVVAEAMSCGLPVIVNNIPGLRSIVTNGVDGFVVPLNNKEAYREKIDILLNSPELCNQMGSAGRYKVVTNFSWPKVVDQLEAIYKEIIAERMKTE